MADLNLEAVPMPQQEPRDRIHNFGEVTLGYTPEMAVQEARRCLQCKNPMCVKGCPVNIRIPEFIARVAQEDFEGAYEIIAQSNGMPAITGRVCPQEVQCEAKCVLGKKGEPVAIGWLERFVADWHLASDPTTAIPHYPANYTHVAVIGSGPAGLTCAYDLAQLGYSVTLYEAFHTIGGVLVYGIPAFRLPKDLVARTEADLHSLGVQIYRNMVMGRVLTLQELFDKGYKAIFVATGAGLPKFMGIPGEGLPGVCSANEYLTRVNLMHAARPDYDTPCLTSRSVAVVGGGNVAMDAARCALRLGAREVSIVYRRSMEEIPARAEEVEHAREEGIIFRLLTNPGEVLGDGKGWVRALRCAEMELGEPDSTGRRRPVEKPGAFVEIPADCVIMAIGTSPNPLLAGTTPGLDTQKWGGIVADENGRTSLPRVYAGGDAVTGAATVILAMGAGKTAARSILEDFRSVR